MSLTRYEIKERLGHGGARRVARALGLSDGHVSMVINERRTDRRVATAIARRIQVRLADLPVRYYQPEDLSTTRVA